MNEIDQNRLLMDMKIIAEKAKGVDFQSIENEGVQGEFGTLLKQAIEQVNQHQNEANELATKFEAGDESVSLSQVMISMQKSNLSLQAMAQVRNRLVSAYQEIMNMPI